MATANEIKQKLLDGLGSAVNLQIVTYVGELKPDITADDGSGTLKIKWTNLPPGNSNFVIATQIDLAEGDIINIIPAGMDTPENKWLKDYHLEQVKAGKDIVASNLKMIAEMAEKILKLVG